MNCYMQRHGAHSVRDVIHELHSACGGALLAGLLDQGLASAPAVDILRQGWDSMSMGHSHAEFTWRCSLQQL